MGLRDGIQAATKGAFNALGDVARPAMLRTFSERTYDAVSDTMAQVTTESACAAVLTRPTKEEIEGGAVESDDVIALVPAAGLLAPPTPDNELSVDGTTYRVVSVRSDPAAAHYRLVLRA